MEDGTHTFTPFFPFAVVGASSMLGKHFTTELHPQSNTEPLMCCSVFFSQG